MTLRQCFCRICEKEHLLRLAPAEFKALLKVVKKPFDAEGRLFIGCDVCAPFPLRPAGRPDPEFAQFIDAQAKVLKEIVGEWNKKGT